MFLFGCYLSAIKRIFIRIDEELYKSVRLWTHVGFYQREGKFKSTSRVERAKSSCRYISLDISLIIAIINFIRFNRNLAVVPFDRKIPANSFFRGRDPNENIFSKESLKMGDWGQRANDELLAELR